MDNQTPAKFSRVLLLVCSALMSGLLLIRAQAAEPAASAQIPPAVIAKADIYHSAKLSPDGKHIAVVLTQEGRRLLIVLTLDGFKMVGQTVFSGRDEVGQVYWVNNKRLVISVVQTKPWLDAPQYYGELYGVNYDGTDAELIYGYRAQSDRSSIRIKRKTATFGWAEIIDILPDDDKHILISSTPMSSGGDKLARVHKINVHTGVQSRKLMRSPVPYATFTTDQQSNVRIVTGTDDENVNRAYWYMAEKSEWVEIPQKDIGEQFSPLGFDQSGDWLYVVDNQAQDKSALVKMHTKTGQRKTLYVDKEVNITDVVFDAEGSGVYAVRIDPGYPTYVIVDTKHPEAQIFKSLVQTFSGYKVNIVSRSDDGSKNVVMVSADTMPSSFYLYDVSKNSLAPLFNNLTDLTEKQLARTETIRFEARDGLTIHGYFTRPLGVAKDAKIPLVTLVHGGPHGIRDYWLYDREVQLLASLGYGVLRVNFRGSGGYGQAFQEAGYRHWGDDMQHDIIDGTRWAIDHLNINGDKVCIMGGSFGGYSAVQSATIAPDLFQCVVANAGVYDLEMMYEEGDIPDRGFGESYLEMALGNDKERLRAFSPVHRAQLLQAPVLIAHGSKDRRVPIEQAEALKAQLEKHNKPHEWFIRSTEAHGFYDEKNRAEYFEAVTTFLQQHLSDDAKLVAR